MPKCYTVGTFIEINHKSTKYIHICLLLPTYLLLKNKLQHINYTTIFKQINILIFILQFFKKQ